MSPDAGTTYQAIDFGCTACTSQAHPRALWIVDKLARESHLFRDNSACRELNRKCLGSDTSRVQVVRRRSLNDTLFDNPHG